MHKFKYIITRAWKKYQDIGYKWSYGKLLVPKYMRKDLVSSSLSGSEALFQCTGKYNYC